MKNKFYIIIFLFLIATPKDIFAQKRYGYHIQTNQKRVVIPFELYNNLIIIKMKMNGLPINFLLDTGVRHTILVKREYADILGIEFSREVSLLGADKNQIMTAYVANDVHMAFDSIVNEREILLILEEDYLEFERLFGADVQGIVGFEIFRRFVVKINYTNKMITLYPKETFKAPKSKKYHNYYIALNDTKPYMNMNITLENEDTVQGKFLLDTGASFDLLLDINSSDKIDFPKNVIVGDMGHGLGGALEGKIGRVKQVDFEPFDFERMTTFYQNDTLFNEIVQDDRNGIIGGGVLSRFNVIFDYSRNVVYFKKNKKYRTPFYYNMSGIVLTEGNNNAVNHIIEEVIPNSPASEAGILKGDRIIKMNGVKSPTLTRTYVKTQFKTKEGKKMKLEILRGDKLIIKHIKLRELI